ncbi:MAG: hypothetical protein HMLKMBBP_01888 [Planctomycetes bacterium]|nr:hypothetical protein [Planctomycetota bacterium]
MFAAALGGLALWQPAAGAVETDEARTRRLADESRVAEVARKLETEARKIEQCAIDRKMPQLATEAAVIKRAAEQMKREPPPPEQALQQLSTLLDAQRDAIRKRGDLKPTDDPRAVLEQEKQLAELLRQMAEAKAESVQQDLDDLVKRLAKDPKSDGAPTGDDLRELANRMDALRKAAKAAEEAGMDAAGLKKKLRDLGNEDLLEKIAEQLREMAAKLDDRNYQDLEQAAEDLPDLADMSREELEKLLKDLKEMAESGDLQKMLEGAKGEMSGGRRFRPGAPGGG